MELIAVLVFASQSPTTVNLFPVPTRVIEEVEQIAMEADLEPTS